MTRWKGTPGLRETTQKIILCGVQLLNVINGFIEDKLAQNEERRRMFPTLLENDVLTSRPGSSVDLFSIVVGILGFLLPRRIS